MEQNNKIKTKKWIIITSIITILPMIIGIIYWNQLPERMATHFGEGNIPNGWSDKGFAVFGLPIFMLVVHLLCQVALIADPKREKISDKIFMLLLWIVPVTFLVCSISIYGYALGWPGIDVGLFANLLVGVVFIVIGNYLPKCKQNYTVGIKISWTLNDEENWNKTHRFAGRLWVLCGILMIIGYLCNVGEMILVIILTAAFVPMLYSFLLFIRHKK